LQGEATTAKTTTTTTPPPVYCNEAFRKRTKAEAPKPKSFLELCSAPDFDCVCGSQNDIQDNDSTDTLAAATAAASDDKMQQQPPPARLGEIAGNAGRAFSNFATSSLQNLTQRRYTLPDKSVASQVLMYRQLLHTKCRPGLKLSRDYQGTPAQKAVLHMPVSAAMGCGLEETQLICCANYYAYACVIDQLTQYILLFLNK
jgi:hypothetical protein